MGIKLKNFMTLDNVKNAVGKLYCIPIDLSEKIQSRKIEVEISKCNSLGASCQSESYIKEFFKARVFTTGVF